jgi:hypothetical protein
MVQLLEARSNVHLQMKDGRTPLIFTTSMTAPRSTAQPGDAALLQLLHALLQLLPSSTAQPGWASVRHEAFFLFLFLENARHKISRSVIFSLSFFCSAQFFFLK